LVLKDRGPSESRGNCLCLSPSLSTRVDGRGHFRLPLVGSVLQRLIASGKRIKPPFCLNRNQNDKLVQGVLGEKEPEKAGDPGLTKGSAWLSHAPDLGISERGWGLGVKESRGKEKNKKPGGSTRGVPKPTESPKIQPILCGDTKKREGNPPYLWETKMGIVL